MASTTSPPSPVCLLLGSRGGNATWKKRVSSPIQGAVARRKDRLRVCAFGTAQDAEKRPKAVDTRIHWANEDEGWVGGSGTNSVPTEEQLKAEAQQKNFLGDKFADLLYSSDSHYQFLGVAPDADIEEIKGSYRRLSKEFHPDTTSLPLKTAFEKFMRLREIYHVLSDEESRKFYDWTLAQEVASREAEKMRMKLEDPFIQDFVNYEPVPDMVDRLGGKNLKLSDQAMTALTFDIMVVIFSICCIIYAVFFKEY